MSLNTTATSSSPIQNDMDATSYGYNATTINASATAKEPYERPFGDIAIWISAAIIFSFLIIGFVLNLLTILVIAKYPQIRNLFVYFIFSLCISDLISAIISPFFWYRRTLGFDDFAIPDFFCRFYWAADLMTSFATALHILAFGLLRYASVKFPFWYQKVTGRHAKIFIIGIWVVTFCCGFIPYSIWFGARFRDRYGDSEDARWPACTINMEWYGQYTLYQKIAYALFLYAPIVIVVLVSALTAYEVRANSISSNANVSEARKRKERQAVLQLLLIVASFLLGYLPFTAYEFWSTQDHGNSRYVKVFDYYFGLSEYFFIRFSECLNPIFYNLGSSRMRQSTRNYLQELFGKESKRRRSITATSDVVS